MKTVFAQEYKDFEVILVDNQSSDKTLEKVRSFEVRVVSIDDYSPGKALNTGIRSSSGEYTLYVCPVTVSQPTGNGSKTRCGILRMEKLRESMADSGRSPIPVISTSGT